MRAKKLYAGIVLLAGAVALSGCSAVHTAVKKRNLDVQTKMSETVFLEPVSPAQKVIYLSIKNTSDKQFEIKDDIVKLLRSSGFEVTSDPAKAQFMLQANVLQVGKTDLRTAESALVSGFGGAVSGAALVAAGGGSGRQAAAGGLVGAALGVVGDALVDDVYYSVITDLQVRERPRAGEVVTQTQSTDANIGTMSRVNQSVKGGKIEWKTYRTRIVSTANKVNLEFAEAEPKLKEGLAMAISGLFRD